MCALCMCVQLCVGWGGVFKTAHLAINNIKRAEKR